MLKKGEPIGYRDKEGTNLCVGDWIEGPRGRGRINGTKVSFGGDRVAFDKVEFTNYLVCSKPDKEDFADIKSAKQDRARIKKSIFVIGDFVDTPQGTGILKEVGNVKSELFVAYFNGQIVLDVEVETDELDLAKPINKVLLVHAMKFYGYSMDWEVNRVKRTSAITFKKGSFVTNGIGYGVVDKSLEGNHTLKVWVSEGTVYKDLNTDFVFQECNNDQIVEFYIQLSKLGLIWTGSLESSISKLPHQSIISEVKRRGLNNTVGLDIKLSEATEDEIVAELKNRKYTGNFIKMYSF